VKGSFSVALAASNARRALSFLELDSTRDFARYPRFMFDRLLASKGSALPDTAHFLAEEVLSGDLVTVEGFAHTGRGHGPSAWWTRSFTEHAEFVRFEYPSAAPCARAGAHARKSLPAPCAALRLDHGPLQRRALPTSRRADASTWSRSIRASPASSPDLYEKVDGTSSYALLLALAAGERPIWQRRARSLPVRRERALRIFEPRAWRELHVLPMSSRLAEALLRRHARLTRGRIGGDAQSDFGAAEGRGERAATPS
jgi:hypothetical protein